MNAATAASYSSEDIIGAGPIGFSRLRVIVKHPVRIASPLAVLRPYLPQLWRLLTFLQGIARSDVASSGRCRSPAGRPGEPATGSRAELCESFRFVQGSL